MKKETRLELLKAFLEICFLRRAPQDLPASPLLLYMALGANLLSVIFLSLGSYTLFTAILTGIVDTMVLVILSVSILYMQGKGVRAVQTITALAGTGALIGFLAVLPTYWWFWARADGNTPALPVLLLLVMVAWSLMVMGHILRHALSVQWIVGLVVAGIFYWVAVTVREGLFQLPAGM